MVFDKLSLSDYAVAAAYTTIQMSGGPVMLDDFFYGRKDAADASECGDLNNYPTSDTYVQSLSQKGFSADEIAALASVEAMDSVQKESRWSPFPKMDNYYYQQLLMENSRDLPLAGELLGNSEVKESVEKFAEDKAAYHQTFKGAFVKLCELGTDSMDLIDIEEFGKDEPHYKIQYPGALPGYERQQV